MYGKDSAYKNRKVHDEQNDAGGGGGHCKAFLNGLKTFEYFNFSSAMRRELQFWLINSKWKIFDTFIVDHVEVMA